MKRCMRFINVQLEKVGNKIKSISFFKDKVNIVFLNEWKMEISKDTYTDFYLYEGKELDKEEIENIQEKDKINSIKRSAFKLINNRMYSYHELKKRLLEKGYSQDLVVKVLEDLKEHKFIDDNKLSLLLKEEYDEKLYGQEKIKHLLLNKGIDEKIVNQLEFDEEVELVKCQKLVEEYMRKNKNLSYSSLKNKAWNYLISYGYIQKIVTRAMTIVNQNVSKEDDKEKLLTLMDKYIIIHRVDILDKSQKEKLIKRYLAKGYSKNVIEECIKEVQWKN